MKFIKILFMKDYANSHLKLKQTVIWAFCFHKFGWYLKVKVGLLKAKTLFTEGKGFFTSFSCSGNVRSLISHGSQTWRFHSAFILQCSLLHLALNWVLELLSDPDVMRSTPSLCPLHLTKSSHLSFVWWWLTNIVKQLCLSFATFKNGDMSFWLGQCFFIMICHFDWDDAFSRRTAVWVFSEIQRKTTSLWALLLAQLKEELQSSSFNHKTRKSKSIPVCLTFYNQNGTLWLKP